MKDQIIMKTSPKGPLALSHMSDGTMPVRESTAGIAGSSDQF